MYFIYVRAGGGRGGDRWLPMGYGDGGDEGLPPLGYWRVEAWASVESRIGYRGQVQALVVACEGLMVGTCHAA